MKLKYNLSTSEDGRKWIQANNSFQCASCLYFQPCELELAVRESGIVVGINLPPNLEAHSEVCIQKTEINL